MPKQARAKQTYELVLDAAAVEFARHGYANANLQHVANRTGLTKGALYGHFPSKEALASAVVARLDELIAELGETPDPASASGIQQLRELTADLALRLHTDIRAAAALRLTMETGQDTGQAPQFLGDVQRLLLGAVLRAQREGAVHPSWTAELIAELVGTLLFGVFYTASASDSNDLSCRFERLWSALVPLFKGPPAA